MEPDDGPWEVCAALAAQFCNPDGTRRWRIWPRVTDGLFYAWYIGSTPVVVLKDVTLAGLKVRMEMFERVYAGKAANVARARAEAEGLLP